jgi:hypothetical protein
MHRFNNNWDGIHRKTLSENLSEASSISGLDGKTMTVLSQVQRAGIDALTITNTLDELEPILKMLHDMLLASKDKNVKLTTGQDNKIAKVLANIGNEQKLSPAIPAAVKQIKILRRVLGGKE